MFLGNMQFTGKNYILTPERICQIYTLSSSQFQTIFKILQWLPFFMKTGKEMAQYPVKRSASRQSDTTQHTSGAQGSIQAHAETISQQDLLP